MNTFITIFSHLIIITGMILMFINILILIWKGKDYKEKGVRSTAFSLGILIYFASKLTKLSIPELIFSSIQLLNFQFFIVGFLIPSFCGYFCAMFILRAMKKEVNVEESVIILMSTIIIFLFLDCYVSSYTISDKKILFPNLTFVIGIGLYIILKYNKGKANDRKNIIIR